jgi:hypothetical protein
MVLEIYEAAIAAFNIRKEGDPGYGRHDETDIKAAVTQIVYKYP